MSLALLSIVFGACFFVILFINFNKIKSFYERKTTASIEKISSSLFLLNTPFKEEAYKKSFYTFCGAMTLLAFLATWPNPFLALVIAAVIQVLAWKVPPAFLESNVKKRIALIEDKMIDALVLMSNGIKAGLSVQQSMDRVTQNLRGPIKEEFEVVLSKIQLGSNTEEALSSMYDRVPSQDVQMFTSSVAILKETGGNMSETFDTTVYTIRERQKIARKIDALTAQARTQGAIMAGLPFVFLVFFAFTQTENMILMATKPLGWALFLGICFLTGAGALTMKKLAVIEV